MEYYIPILIVVGANITYDICTKAVPHNINHFAGLTITYLCLAFLTLVLFYIIFPNESLLENFKIVNWAVVLYGVSSVGLESGYILLFRGGWSISLGGLVCNITLAVIMIFVGAAFFSETLSPMQFGGIACCLLGLIFISKSDIDKSEEAL